MAPRERSEPAANPEIANLLRRIRDDAGVTSGGRAGQLIGVSQATISRWEKGTLIPSPEDADRYARALGASAASRRELVDMALDLHEQHQATTPPARVALGRSAYHEKRVLRNERRAKRISWFHPLLLPGALQTSAYVRAVMSSGDLSLAEVDERVSTRLKRARVIEATDRQLTFVLTTGALGWRVGNPEVMAQQIEYLIEADRRTNVRLGVIPWGTEVKVFPPCGFDIYDDHTVVVGVVGGAAYYNDPKDVALYVAMFTKLEQLAVWGDDARAELQRIAADYRGLS
jgi:transcriptional regulator with XRE-family HTH domain